MVLSQRVATDLLAAAAVEARAKWSDVGHLEDAVFRDAVASRVEGEIDVATALERMALAEIYFAVACLRGDRAALAAFETMVRDAAARVVSRLGTLSPAPEDLAQELLLKMLVGPQPKLAAFSGHGTLRGWLHVAATRSAISMMRRAREDLADDEALVAVADDGDDQALALLKASYRAEFKRAFAATLAELPARSRTLLRLQIVDQLTYEDVAAFYDVSRATAARWLADARHALVSDTRRRLAATLAIDPDELTALMTLVASRLYSTLPGLLRHAA